MRQRTAAGPQRVLAAYLVRNGRIMGSRMHQVGVIVLAWISQTYRCIGAENLRKMLCCNSFSEVQESPDADRVYAEAV